MLNGVGWVEGGRDPSVGFDCMGIVICSYRARGIEIPDLASPDGGALAPGAVSDFASLWRELEDGEPVHVGDVGLMRKWKETDYSHVVMALSRRWAVECNADNGILRRPMEHALKVVATWMRYEGPGAEALE